MMTARRQSPPPPVHRLSAPAVPVDGIDARGKVQGKIKGGGTWPLGNPVCTWGWRGTRQGSVACREGTQFLIGIREVTCLALSTAPRLDGGAR